MGSFAFCINAPLNARFVKNCPRPWEWHWLSCHRFDNREGAPPLSLVSNCGGFLFETCFNDWRRLFNTEYIPNLGSWIKFNLCWDIFFGWDWWAHLRWKAWAVLALLPPGSDASKGASPVPQEIPLLLSVKPENVSLFLFKNKISA